MKVIAEYMFIIENFLNADEEKEKARTHNFITYNSHIIGG